MEFVLPQVLWRILINPNVTYALLILGTWSIIAAIITPGWGIPEGLTVVCWALASVGLLKLPTNVAALILILAAIPLYLAEIKAHSHGALALLATLLLTLGSIFLFHSPNAAERVSRWLIALVSLGTLAFIGLFIYLIPAPSHPPSAQRVKKGDVGIARTALKPDGIVYVADEEWSARSVNEYIPEGAPVEIVDVQGLVVWVKRIRALPVQARKGG